MRSAVCVAALLARAAVLLTATMRREFFAATIAATLIIASELQAGAAEIHVVAPNAVKTGMQTLATSFTQETGTAVNLTFANAGTIPAMLGDDTNVDLVVLLTADMDAAERNGALKQNTKTNLGRIEIAFVVKAGATHPDISTPAKFRSALLAASSVAVNDPSTGSAGGIIVAGVLKDPQLAGVKTKAVPAAPARVMAQGGAEVALQSMSEVMGAPGIEVVGPIPPYWQAHLDFSVAVPAKSPVPDMALSFLRYITRPEVAAAWRMGGIDR